MATAFKQFIVDSSAIRYIAYTLRELAIFRETGEVEVGTGGEISTQNLAWNEIAYRIREYVDLVESGEISEGGGGGGGMTNEQVRDIIGAALSGEGLIAVQANDEADTIVITTTATANSSDATLLNRDNHTGTQTADTISDLTAAIRTAVAAFLVEGTNITLDHDTEGGTLSISAAGGEGGESLTEENVRDIIGLALSGTGLITVTPNDGSDTIVISTTATANSSDATLLDRANHTGTQAISTVSGLQDALDNKAPKDSPALTGNPTAPTQTSSDNSTKLATTAFVKAQGYAALASPAFTGNPTAPTPTASDNDTSIATTAFVKNQNYAPIIVDVEEEDEDNYADGTIFVWTTA